MCWYHLITIQLQLCPPWTFPVMRELVCEHGSFASWQHQASSMEGTGGATRHGRGRGLSPGSMSLPACSYSMAAVKAWDAQDAHPSGHHGHCHVGGSPASSTGPTGQLPAGSIGTQGYLPQGFQQPHSCELCSHPGPAADLASRFPAEFRGTLVGRRSASA